MTEKEVVGDVVFVCSEYWVPRVESHGGRSDGSKIKSEVKRVFVTSSYSDLFCHTLPFFSSTSHALVLENQSLRVLYPS